MRRLHVINGLKQRLGEILGQQLSGGAVGDVTSWSIQAAMLSNMNRIVSALVGNSQYGRVLRGLEITKKNATWISISKGYGITENGGIISVCHQSSATGIDIQLTTDATHYVHLRHNIIKLDNDTYPGRKSTGVINELGNVDIVYDEQAMAQGSGVSIDEVVFINTTGPVTDNNDMIYLGSVVRSGGDIQEASITPTGRRGLSPNLEDGHDIFDFIQVITQLNVDGLLQCSDINSTGDVDIDGDLNVDGDTTLAKVTTSDDVICGGKIQVAETLEVTGEAGFGNVNASGDVTVAGAVKGKIEATDIEASGTATIDDWAEVGTDLTVGEELDVAGKADFGDDIELTQAAKGVIMTNAAGTIRRRVRLNDTGDGLLYDSL